jgi:hypothetical protein
MILVFVILTMLIISLMGLILLAAVRAETETAGSRRLTQDSFLQADSAARLAALLSRTVLHPEQGNPQDLLTASAGKAPASPLTVEVNSQRFNLEKLIEESNPFDFEQMVLDSAQTPGSKAKKPHLVFKAGPETAASASVCLDYSNSGAGQGHSLNGSGLYDQSGGGSLPIDILIAVTGGPAAGPGSAGQSQPRSIISVIIRDLM